MTNPVLIALSRLLRLQYGDSLDYVDGGYTGGYKDRVEAALVLVETGKVKRQRVRSGNLTTYRYYVESQEFGRLRLYYPSMQGEPDCTCQDFQNHRAPVCVHQLALWLSLSLEAGFKALKGWSSEVESKHHALA